MPGKYFIAVNSSNGLVLDVSGNSRNAGAEVIMFNRKVQNNFNQQWYEDINTSTIRSRLNDLCFDISGNGTLVLNPYNPASNHQKWELNDQKGVIQNNHNTNKVLGIKDHDKEPNAKLCEGHFKSKPVQMWKFDYLEVDTFFTIISEMHDKVLEVQGANAAPGTRVCMNRPNGGVHQQWFESKKGIRSKLNKLPLTSNGVLSDGAAMMANPAGPGKPDNHFWVISGGTIINKTDRNMVCDIAGCDGRDGAGLIARRIDGQPNQLWRFQPVK